jgi:hypothetical protein
MKKTKCLLLLFIISFFIVFEESCSHPTEPSTNQPAGRRNYSWTVDTIKTADELLFTSMWGISDTNVWATGSSGSSRLTIWHYNGSTWGCDSIWRPLNPWAIIGFSQNEVWLGSINSTIWKYNGSEWQQYGSYKINGYDNILIQNFDGLSSNYIYGVGGAEVYNSNTYKGIIMEYDGTTWKFVNIPFIKIGFVDGKIDKSSGILILEGTVYDTTGWISKIHAWDGNQLKELYSGYTYANVGSVQHEVLVSINKKIYRYSNGQLALCKDLSNTDCIGKIWCGRSENDFFMCSSTGIGHYNGTDFITIFTKNNSNICAGYIFDKDVFFIMNEPDNSFINYIIHGKLN